VVLERVKVSDKSGNAINLEDLRPKAPEVPAAE
jgi:hypothetical protein